LFAHAATVTEKNFAAEAFYAMTVLALGDIEEAERHVQRALEINPDFTTAIEVQAMVRASQGRLAESEAGFRRVLKNRNNPGRTYNSLGNVLLREEKYDEAESAFHSALEDKPDLLEAHWGLAEIERIRGNPAQAATHLRLALKGEPERALGWVTLGDTLARLHQFDEAAKSYERAAQLTPRNPEIYARLGYLKIIMNRPDEALAHWETALRLNPEFPGLRERMEKVRSAPR
jgi:tetratricopeptide (TPR) repeat protein